MYFNEIRYLTRLAIYKKKCVSTTRMGSAHNALGRF